MKPMIRNLVCLGLAVAASQAVAQSREGTAEGNGGVAVVCRSPRGQIRSAELLDIYEARILPPQLRFTASELPVETQVELAQLRMMSNPAFLAAFQHELAALRAHIFPLPRGAGIPPTNDAFPEITQQGCDFENVANYRADGTVLIDQEIFDALSTTNKAALYIHEAVYALARTHVHDQSSVRSRRLVAQLLATDYDTSVIAQLMGDMLTPSATWRTLTLGTYVTPSARRCGIRIVRFIENELILQYVRNTNYRDVPCSVDGQIDRYTCHDASCARTDTGGTDTLVVLSPTQFIGQFTPRGASSPTPERLFELR